MAGFANGGCVRMGRIRGLTQSVGMGAVMAGDAGRYVGRKRMIEGDGRHEGRGVVTGTAGVACYLIVACAHARCNLCVMAGKAVGGGSEAAVVRLSVGHPSCGRVAEAAVVAVRVFAANYGNVGDRGGWARDSVTHVGIMAVGACFARGSRRVMVKVDRNEGRGRMTTSA